jgi:hypothetical protein
MSPRTSGGGRGRHGGPLADVRAARPPAGGPPCRTVNRACRIPTDWETNHRRTSKDRPEVPRCRPGAEVSHPLGLVLGAVALVAWEVDRMDDLVRDPPQPCDRIVSFDRRTSRPPGGNDPVAGRLCTRSR